MCVCVLQMVVDISVAHSSTFGSVFGQLTNLSHVSIIPCHVKTWRSSKIWHITSDGF